MSRIIILGCAGSGKTTLARRLGECTRAPVICLDALWQSLGKEKDISTFRALTKQAHAGDTWISDGNFAQATFDIRLPRATLVIWLECSKLCCAWRAIVRVFKPGEHHQACKLMEVLRFIWNFDRVNRPRIEAFRLSHGPSVPVRKLMGGPEVAAFLASQRIDSTSPTT